MDFESYVQVGLMQFPAVVTATALLVATSRTQMSRFAPIARPKAIHFPFGDHDGQVSSNGCPPIAPRVSCVSLPPPEGTLYRWYFAKMTFPSMVCCRVGSYSFPTYAIHFPSADHVGCPGLPLLLVTCLAM